MHYISDVSPVVGKKVHNFKKAFCFLKNLMCDFWSYSPSMGDSFNTSSKFGRMKGSGGLFKRTKFVAAALIYGDIRPLTICWGATETRPAGDALAYSEDMFLVLKCFACRQS